jgi:hypothetical protein
MIQPGFQWQMPILLTCPGCGRANPNQLPWTASNFILATCANANCPDFDVQVLVEKSSLTVVMATQTGGER